MTLRNTFQNAGSLLASIDAIRNIRALLVLVVSLGLTGLLFGLAGMLGVQAHWSLGLLMGLLALVVLFYGSMANGIMLMDEAKGGESRPALAAVISALATGHRFILVLLLVGVIYLVGLAAMALLLLITKIPGIGPVLFTLIFPVLVVVSGMALVSLYLVVFPLAAPAIWEGATTMQAVYRLMAIARERLITVLVLMFLLFLLTGLVGGFIALILGSGTAITAALSAGIVGPSLNMGSLFSMMGGFGGGFGGGGSGYFVAAGIGGGVLWMLGLSLPLLVYIRGCCQVYLLNVAGVDVEGVEASMRKSMEEARTKAEEIKAKAQEIQAKAEEAAAKRAQAQDASSPAPAAPVPAPAAPAAPAASVTPAAPQHACPACGSEYQPGDRFCGTCGHKLS